MEYGQNMMLFKSFWQTSAGDYQETFKLMPVTTECPYSEGIFDTNTGMLVIISKSKNETFKMLPALNDLGEVQYTKQRKNKPYKEQRQKVNLSTEYVLIDKNEIFNFIQLFCVNHDTFSYKRKVEEAIERRESMNKTPNKETETKE